MYQPEDMALAPAAATAVPTGLAARLPRTGLSGEPIGPEVSLARAGVDAPAVAVPSRAPEDQLGLRDGLLPPAAALMTVTCGGY
ncbi:hypothetical protein ACFVT2_14120 [Streptomyces sp. NPDC058000]|uniref:hypothetical protein n=1 Tax=Streptomyces sp. NPDC058000 TaxID=3346299 RepID=UPI0036EE3BC4